jgi:hypothetical protein
MLLEPLNTPAALRSESSTNLTRYGYQALKPEGAFELAMSFSFNLVGNLTPDSLGFLSPRDG